MGFVFVAFWMLACVDLLCLGSLLGLISRVLEACWSRFVVFWELAGVNFSCYGSLKGSLLRLERRCLPCSGLGHFQETYL